MKERIGIGGWVNKYDTIWYDTIWCCRENFVQASYYTFEEIEFSKIKLFSQESIFDREQTTCNYSRNHSFAMHF